MLDLNPSVYVIIDPCCPQKLKKMGPPDITGSGFLIKPASSLSSPLRQDRKPGLNGPLRGDNYPDTGGKQSLAKLRRKLVRILDGEIREIKELPSYEKKQLR